jgi:hypothetical protein
MPRLDLGFQFEHLAVQVVEVIQQAGDELPKQTRQRIVRVFRQLGDVSSNLRDPLGDDQTEFAQQPANLVGCAVRALTKPCLTRCRDRTACCPTVLTGTNRMLGRVTASQIASASAASFLLVLTYGFTNCGAISLTVCPRLSSSRAQ